MKILYLFRNAYNYMLILFYRLKTLERYADDFPEDIPF